MTNNEKSVSDNRRERDSRDENENVTNLVTEFDGQTGAEDGEAELKLPGYQVLHQLGSGGMGRVFLARQIEPVDRQVAIKLIQRRIRNPAGEVHFLIERQALAQMQHPAIAQIFEAGTNPDGFPYFAMEYVPGASLLEFCNDHQLDIRARLNLFTRICHGVAHAHQKGIVHRDLKPSNILVSLVDGTPHPKIIDFGIAVAETSARERRRQDSVGTPVYMSPELFDDTVSFDTRADIYSLGVILCELLCDQAPVSTRQAVQSHRYHDNPQGADPTDAGIAFEPVARRRGRGKTKLLAVATLRPGSCCAR